MRIKGYTNGRQDLKPIARDFLLIFLLNGMYKNPFGMTFDKTHVWRFINAFFNNIAFLDFALGYG